MDPEWHTRKRLATRLNGAPTRLSYHLTVRVTAPGVVVIGPPAPGR